MTHWAHLHLRRRSASLAGSVWSWARSLKFWEDGCLWHHQGEHGGRRKLRPCLRLMLSGEWEIPGEHGTKTGIPCCQVHWSPGGQLESLLEIGSWRKIPQKAVWKSCLDTMPISGAPKEGHTSGKVGLTSGALGKLREEHPNSTEGTPVPALTMSPDGGGARSPSPHGGFWPCRSAQRWKWSCLFRSVSLSILPHAKWIYIL